MTSRLGRSTVYARASVPVLPQLPLDLDTTPCARKLMLIAEDEPALRRLLRDVFLSEGYRVIEAWDGAQFLDLLRVVCPDVVILDLMMPVMTGWTFLDEYRRLDGCTDVPIIAMSAMFDMPHAATALRALGVRACVSKPFDLEALLS